MTGLWEQNRPYTIALVAWTIGAGVVWLALHVLFAGPVSALNEGGTGKELRKHYRTTAPAQSFERAEESAQAERTKLNDELTKARTAVEFRPGPAFTVDAKEAQRAYKYVQIRGDVTGRLRELANRANVVVPPELDPRGESKDLPKEEETDELLYRLAMTDRAVRSAASAGVAHILAIRHEMGAPHGVPLAERVVRVKVEGSLDSLVRFVKECSTPPASDAKEDAGGGILAVRSAEILNAGGGGATLAAEFALSAITFVEVKPVKRVTTVTGPPARRGF